MPRARPEARKWGGGGGRSSGWRCWGRGGAGAPRVPGDAGCGVERVRRGSGGRGSFCSAGEGPAQRETAHWPLCNSGTDGLSFLRCAPLVVAGGVCKLVVPPSRAHPSQNAVITPRRDSNEPAPVTSLYFLSASSSLSH